MVATLRRSRSKTAGTCGLIGLVGLSLVASCGESSPSVGVTTPTPAPVDTASSTPTAIAQQTAAQRQLDAAIAATFRADTGRVRQSYGPAVGC
jgi:hypothetical protein